VGEPDQQVSSVTYQYTGTRYEVTWSGPKNSSLQFDIAYKTSSMKSAGFASGTSGGTIPATGSAYTNVIWSSPNMAESGTGMYVAIQPSGQSNFTEVYIPNSAGGPTPTPTPTSRFQANDWIQAIANTNVRSTPSISGTLLGTQPQSSIGTILSGPTQADGFNWFNIDYMNAPDGYSADTGFTLGGDLNFDLIVNSLDWSVMNGQWFTSTAQSDLNKDSFVNSFDFGILNKNWGR
jgi:hypothetical protein